MNDTVVTFSMPFGEDNRQGFFKITFIRTQLLVVVVQALGAFSNKNKNNTLLHLCMHAVWKQRYHRENLPQTTRKHGTRSNLGDRLVIVKPQVPPHNLFASQHSG
jgi:hypothetical protein